MGERFTPREAQNFNVEVRASPRSTCTSSYTRVLEYVEITKNQENHEGQTMKNISRFYRLRNDDATTRHAATTARLSVVVLHYLLCILY